MTASSLQLPISESVMDWQVVSAKIHGTLTDVRGVVRLIEGQPRYTHVDIQVPATAIEIRARRRLGLDADLYPFVSFYGWRIRGNPRRSFALDGELRVGTVKRQVVVNVVATGHRIDDATGTEEAAFHAHLVIDRHIRFFVDTLIRRVPSPSSLYPRA